MKMSHVISYSSGCQGDETSGGGSSACLQASLCLYGGLRRCRLSLATTDTRLDELLPSLLEESPPRKASHIDIDQNDIARRVRRQMRRVLRLRPVPG